MNVRHPKPPEASTEQSRHLILVFLIFCLLTITSTIFSEESLPQLNTGLFSIHIMDVLVLTLTLVGLNRTFLSSSLSTPIILMVFYCLISCIYSVASGNSDINNSLREFRTMLLYLLSVPIVGKLASVSSFSRIYKVLLTLGYLTAITMIIQYTFGLKVQFLAGRVENLETMGNITEGVTRILPPGNALIFLLFIFNLSMLCFGRNIGRRLLVTLTHLTVFGVALLLTFNRCYWASSVLSVFVFLAFCGFRRFMKGMLVFGVLSLMILAGLTLSPRSSIVNAIEERFVTITSVGSTVKKDTSLTARKFEYIRAWEVFTSNPVMGLGLGAAWRTKIGSTDTMTRYTHNGFLGLLIKFGILGFVIFMIPYFWLTTLFLRNVRHLNHWPDSPKVIGLLAFLLAVFISDLVAPMFLQHFSIPLIAIATSYSFSFLKQIETDYTTAAFAAKATPVTRTPAEFHARPRPSNSEVTPIFAVRRRASDESA